VKRLSDGFKLTPGSNYLIYFSRGVAARVGRFNTFFDTNFSGDIHVVAPSFSKMGGGANYIKFCEDIHPLSMLTQFVLNPVHTTHGAVPGFGVVRRMLCNRALDF